MQEKTVGKFNGVKQAATVAGEHAIDAFLHLLKREAAYLFSVPSFVRNK
jgi:hypothetical protein